MTGSALRCPQCGLAIGPHETTCSGCGADVRLWVRRGARIWGPYDLSTVRDGVAMGRIVGSDEVAVGHGEWLEVATIDFSVREAPRQRREVPSARTWQLCLRVLLVGLLVAGAIGGITYQRWVAYRDDVRCRENLRLIGLARHAYFLDHPPGAREAPLEPRDLAPYLPPVRQYWTCPKTARPYELSAEGRAALGSAPLVWDAPLTGKGPHKGQWHVLQGDGRVVETPIPPARGKPAEGLLAEQRK